VRIPRRPAGTPARRLPRRSDPAAPLLLGQLVMFTGIAALFPVVALYVRHRGGSALDAALVIAGPMLANTAVQVPAGRLADRVGRRPVLLGARLAYAALSFALLADRGPLWILALLRAGQGACSGAYTPALLAALTDLTPPDRRATRFSQLQRAELVGLLIGPAIGGAVAGWRESAVFGVSGVAVLVGLGAVVRVPETRAAPPPSADGGAGPPFAWWRSRGIVVSGAALAAVGLVFTMYDVVWPQYLAARGAGTAVIGLSITLFAVPMLVLATPGGRLADRADRRIILGADLAVAGACACSYPALHSLAPILAVGTVESVAFVMTEPSLYATLAESAPPDRRGRVMGLGGLFQFGGAAAGAAVLGALYGVREGLPFWGGGGALLVMAAVCAVAIPGRPIAGRPRLPGAGDAEPAALAIGVLEHRDDARRPHVEGTLLAGQLDELAAGGEGGDGLGHAELDGDVAAVRQTEDRLDRHAAPSRRRVRARRPRDSPG
jgi:MFS transporter, DHA1 family, multidrug resistance protein